MPQTSYKPALTAPVKRRARNSATQAVRDFIVERIRSGVYSSGAALPTERELAEELKVYRRAIRAAVNQLVSEGFVTRRPRCRPTVSSLADARSSDKSPKRISSSNLVALIMWHGGGPLEHAGTSQQRIFWGMNQALSKFGYHPVFLDLEGYIGTEDQNATKEARHLQYVLDQEFGGVVFYPYAYRRNADVVQRVAQNLPLVMLDRKIVGTDVDFVGVDNKRAMFDLTTHLLSLGHRRIAHITQHEPIHSVLDRVEGYANAMRADDADDRLETILMMPPYRDDRHWTVFDAVFGLPPDQRPTAIACVNDYTAVRVAEHLHQFGLTIPEDVSVTGFDNIVPELPGNIGLTTIAQPFEDIGMKAVELLMRRINDPHASMINVELPAKLIVRDSSGYTSQPTGK